jgi:hypothetical protein
MPDEYGFPPRRFNFSSVLKLSVSTARRGACSQESETERTLRLSERRTSRHLNGRKIMVSTSTTRGRRKRRWVRGVTTDSTHPPPGKFSGSATEIARTMARKDVSPRWSRVRNLDDPVLSPCGTLLQASARVTRTRSPMTHAHGNNFGRSRSSSPANRSTSLTELRRGDTNTPTASLTQPLSRSPDEGARDPHGPSQPRAPGRSR